MSVVVRRSSSAKPPPPPPSSPPPDRAVQARRAQSFRQLTQLQFRANSIGSSRGASPARAFSFAKPPPPPPDEEEDDEEEEFLPPPPPPEYEEEGEGGDVASESGKENRAATPRAAATPSVGTKAESSPAPFGSAFASPSMLDAHTPTHPATPSFDDSSATKALPQDPAPGPGSPLGSPGLRSRASSDDAQDGGVKNVDEKEDFPTMEESSGKTAGGAASIPAHERSVEGDGVPAAGPGAISGFRPPPPPSHPPPDDAVPLPADFKPPEPPRNMPVVEGGGSTPGGSSSVRQHYSPVPIMHSVSAVSGVSVDDTPFTPLAGPDEDAAGIEDADDIEDDLELSPILRLTSVRTTSNASSDGGEATTTIDASGDEEHRADDEDDLPLPPPPRPAASVDGETIVNSDELETYWFGSTAGRRRQSIALGKVPLAAPLPPPPRKPAPTTAPPLEVNSQETTSPTSQAGSGGILATQGLARFASYTSLESIADVGEEEDDEEYEEDDELGHSGGGSSMGLGENMAEEDEAYVAGKGGAEDPAARRAALARNLYKRASMVVDSELRSLHQKEAGSLFRGASMAVLAALPHGHGRSREGDSADPAAAGLARVSSDENSAAMQALALITAEEQEEKRQQFLTDMKEVKETIAALAEQVRNASSDLQPFLERLTDEAMQLDSKANVLHGIDTKVEANRARLKRQLQDTYVALRNNIETCTSVLNPNQGDSTLARAQKEAAEALRSFLRLQVQTVDNLTRKAAKEFEELSRGRAIGKYTDSQLIDNVQEAMGDVRRTRERALFAKAHPPAVRQSVTSSTLAKTAHASVSQEEADLSRVAQARLDSLRADWERHQETYLRLETKSHELSSIYRGMAARLEDMQAAAQQQQSSEVDAPREQLVREEAEAAESRRRSAVQALQLEKEGQATKWRELLSAIERENELQLEAMLLQHKEAVDSGIRSITQHIAGTYKVALHERVFKAEQAKAKAEQLRQRNESVDQAFALQRERKEQLQEQLNKIKRLQFLRPRIRELWKLNKTPRRHALQFLDAVFHRTKAMSLVGPDDNTSLGVAVSHARGLSSSPLRSPIWRESKGRDGARGKRRHHKKNGEIEKRVGPVAGSNPFRRRHLLAVLQKQVLRHKLLKQDLRRRRVRLQLEVLRQHLWAPSHNTAVALHKAGLHAVISTDDGTQLYLDKFGEFQEASHGVTALLDQYQRHTGRPFIFSARQVRLQASQERQQLDDIGSAPRIASTPNSNDMPVQPLKWAVDEEYAEELKLKQQILRVRGGLRRRPSVSTDARSFIHDDSNLASAIAQSSQRLEVGHGGTDLGATTDENVLPGQNMTQMATQRLAASSSMPSAAAAANWTYSQQLVAASSSGSRRDHANRRPGTGSPRRQQAARTAPNGRPRPSGGAKTMSPPRRTYPFLPSSQSQRASASRLSVQEELDSLYGTSPLADSAARVGSGEQRAKSAANSPDDGDLRTQAVDGDVQWASSLRSSRRPSLQTALPQRSLSFALNDVSSLLGLTSSASPPGSPRASDAGAAGFQPSVAAVDDAASRDRGEYKSQVRRSRKAKPRFAYDANGRRVRVPNVRASSVAQMPDATTQSGVDGGRQAPPRQHVDVVVPTLSPGPGPLTPGSAATRHGRSLMRRPAQDSGGARFNRELDQYMHTTTELDACSDSMVAFIEQLRE